MFSKNIFNLLIGLAIFPIVNFSSFAKHFQKLIENIVRKTSKKNYFSITYTLYSQLENVEDFSAHVFMRDLELY